MKKQARSLYEGLRNEIDEKCTVESMTLPKIVVDQSATGNGFKVTRPAVNQLKVVICVSGTWMLIDITVIKEVIRSVIHVIREWCIEMLGTSELGEVPDFEDEAISFA